MVQVTNVFPVCSLEHHNNVALMQRQLSIILDSDKIWFVIADKPSTVVYYHPSSYRSAS